MIKVVVEVLTHKQIEIGTGHRSEYSIRLAAANALGVPIESINSVRSIDGAFDPKLSAGDLCWQGSRVFRVLEPAQMRFAPVTLENLSSESKCRILESELKPLRTGSHNTLVSPAGAALKLADAAAGDEPFTVTFKKVDGSIREMICWGASKALELWPELKPSGKGTYTHSKRSANGHILVYDVVAGWWRQVNCNDVFNFAIAGEKFTVD